MTNQATEFDLKDLYTKVYGYVAPPFPALGNLSEQISPRTPLGTINAITEQFKKTVLGTEMVMPLSMGIPELPQWDVPIEPMISIVGGNKIIQRYPKGSEFGGSIKERWSQDDYKITIKGVLIDFTGASYPEYDVTQLRAICESTKSIKVSNPMFRIFGIERIAIKDFDIPFTPGLNNQAFTIKAFSDQLFNSLLIDV